MIDAKKIKESVQKMTPYQIKNIFKNEEIVFNDFKTAWKELREKQKIDDITILNENQSIAFYRELGLKDNWLYIGTLNKDQNKKHFKSIDNFINIVKNIFNNIDNDRLNKIKVKKLLMLFQNAGYPDLYDNELKTIENKAIKNPDYHTDPYEHLFIQVFGKTGWVFKDSNNNLSKVLMQPGDAIFIPKGLEHTVYAFEKRATLTLMMEK